MVASLKGGSVPFSLDCVVPQHGNSADARWLTTLPPLMRSHASCAGAQGAQDARDWPDR